MAGKPKTIDEYLAALSDDKRVALEKLRKTIKATAPKAQECISYGLAAFRLNGKPLVAIGASTNHWAFYLMSASTVEAHKELLRDYDTTMSDSFQRSSEAKTSQHGGFGVGGAAFGLTVAVAAKDLAETGARNISMLIELYTRPPRIVVQPSSRRAGG